MRRLERPPAPSCLCDGAGDEPARRAVWYEDLYKRDGSVKDRWNSEELDDSGVSSVRLHDLAWGLVESRISDDIIDCLIDACGHPTILRTMIAYWRSMLGGRAI